MYVCMGCRESYGGTAEDFFIDMMIQRHARQLVSSARLLALGRLAAALDLHLVAWLSGERERAARVDSAVLCLKRLHDDFAWPYPVLQHDAHARYTHARPSLPSSQYTTHFILLYNVSLPITYARKYFLIIHLQTIFS